MYQIVGYCILNPETAVGSYGEVGYAEIFPWTASHCSYLSDEPAVAVKGQQPVFPYSRVIQDVYPVFNPASGLAASGILCRIVSTRDIACKLDLYGIGRYGQVAVCHELDEPGLCRETVQHSLRQRPSVLIFVQVDYLNAAPVILSGASAEQCCCGDEQCSGSSKSIVVLFHR